MNIEEIKNKSIRTDEENFYLVCEFVRTAEKENRDKLEAWNKLSQFLEDEGYDVKDYE